MTKYSITLELLTTLNMKFQHSFQLIGKMSDIEDEIKKHIKLFNECKIQLSDINIIDHSRDCK